MMNCPFCETPLIEDRCTSCLYVDPGDCDVWSYGGTAEPGQEVHCRNHSTTFHAPQCCPQGRAYLTQCPICEERLTKGVCPRCEREWAATGSTDYPLRSKPRKVKLLKVLEEGDRLDEIIKPVKEA